MPKNEYVISEELNGMRLDKAVTEVEKELSRMAVQRLIEENGITVNRKSRKSFIQNNYTEID